MAKVICAAALQGVIFKVTRVLVDRWGAVGWTYLTGSWPGEKRPDPDDEAPTAPKPRSRYSASHPRTRRSPAASSSCSGRRPAQPARAAAGRRRAAPAGS